MPEIIDDFTKDGDTHYIPLMGPRKKTKRSRADYKIKESVKTNSLRISKSVPKRYVERIEKLLIKNHHCISISQADVGELLLWSGHVFRQEFESEISIP